jgi:hypothetical protein
MLIDTLEALLEGITREQIASWSPVRRMRLTQALRYLADLADPSKPAEPRSGPLARLRAGERAENCE